MVCAVLWWVIALIVTLLVGLLALYKWHHGYWKRKNVPFIEPSFPFGSFENPLRRTKSMGQFLKDRYDEMKSLGHEYVGLYNFGWPIYMPIDPERVKDVMQTNFQHFTDRGFYYNEKEDPLSAHLFAVGGQKWRNLRTKLTPTFTSGKMKLMFETLVECGNPMRDAITEIVDRNEPVDIKEMVAKFTTDVIGSCAFGLDCNSFKSPDAEFRRCGKLIFEFPKVQVLIMMICLSYPKIGRILGLRILNKTATDFFSKIVTDTVKYRESNNVNRADMLNILIELKNTTLKDAGLTMNEIAAQAFVFFVAGFDTSSGTIAHCLFELAKNPKIQQKVRQEIEETIQKHNGKMTYESLADLKYMSQVIDETMRMYPSLPVLTRMCVKDYKLPGRDVVIEKGTRVFIPTYALHYDPNFFPNPNTFDPERFSSENKPQIPQFAYIPFGEGPRTCIGLRFGYMQTKVGLTMLLKNFEFSLNSQTKLPLEIDPNRVLFGVKNTIWLNAKNLNYKKVSC